MNLRNFWMTTLLLTLGVTSAQAKHKEKYPAAPTLTPEQNALIKKAIAAEKLTIKSIQQKLMDKLFLTESRDPLFQRLGGA